MKSPSKGLVTYTLKVKDWIRNVWWQWINSRLWIFSWINSLILTYMNSILKVWAGYWIRISWVRLLGASFGFIESFSLVPRRCKKYKTKRVNWTFNAYFNCVGDNVNNTKRRFTMYLSYPNCPSPTLSLLYRVVLFVFFIPPRNPVSWDIRTWIDHPLD